MLGESEARRRVLDSVQTGSVIWVPLDLALDQVVAQEITGIIDSPPFDNSSMDGYAVRADEAVAGASLRVAEKEQAAGTDAGLEVRSGEAIRIFTGAPLPAGADAVIMQEEVERSGDQIRILSGVTAGENIRRCGGDVCAGQRILDQGEVITPARIGLLASQGIPEIPVYARPLVQIVTTGDELVEPGSPLIAGEIYNSNAPMLLAAVARAGGIGAPSHSRDDRQALAETLERAFCAADLVVVAGGVSVGDRDYVKDVLTDLGVKTEFWRIRVKPGKPFLFGIHPNGVPVFGLPGNPVSAFVTFSLFVAPVIRKVMGFSAEEEIFHEMQGFAGEDMSNPGDRPHYLRGVVRNGCFKLSGTQQSHAIYGLSRANCLIRLEAETTLRKGDPVSALAV